MASFFVETLTCNPIIFLFLQVFPPFNHVNLPIDLIKMPETWQIAIIQKMQKIPRSQNFVRGPGVHNTVKEERKKEK